MKSLIATDAAEYNAATDRVNSALEMLRDEMKSLRHQDVTLMRQFLVMNDTIRSISEDQKTSKGRSKRLRNRTLNISSSMISTTPSWSIPVARQQRVPQHCDVIEEERERTCSVSSDEDSQMASLSDCLSSDEDVCESDNSMTSDGDSDCNRTSDGDSDSDSNRTSDVPVFNRQPRVVRQRSRSKKVCQDINDNENINGLNRNVKLWKRVQPQEEGSDSDSVSEVDSDADEKC